MREILFKGKRVIDGKWTESCCPLGEMHSGTVTYDFESKTVCQYTGLTDKNGRKIFEGDIVKATLLPYQRNQYAIGHITFERGTFKVYVTESINNRVYKNYTGENVKSYSIENNFLERGYQLEIIGNIFDNPGLLEVRNEID